VETRVLARIVALAAVSAWLAPASLSAQSPCGAATLAKTLDAGVVGPRLRTPGGPPIVGESFAMRVDAGAPGATGQLVLGLSRIQVFVPKYSVTLFAGPPYLHESFVLDGAGVSPSLTSIPALDPALCGASAVAQAVVFDASAPRGLAFSNGLRLQIGVANTRPFPGLAVEFPWNPDLMSYGDMDEDGILDLVASDCGLGRIGVALGRGDGSFDLASSEILSVGCVKSVIADFDLDGHPDCALTYDFFAGSVRVIEGLGNGALGAQTTLASGLDPMGIVSADFDQDGNPDLATANEGSDDVSIHRGRGDLTFEGPVFFEAGQDPEGLVGARLDADGAPDLAVYGEQEVRVLIGNGDGSFGTPQVYAMPGAPRGIAADDVDQDAIVDLVVGVISSSSASRIVTLLGLGDGTFAPGPELVLADGIGSEPFLADLDADGILDASFLSADVTFVSSVWRFDVALGRGDGSFDDPALYELNGTLLSPRLADFDADGRFDLVGARLSTRRAVLYRGLEEGTFPRMSLVDALDQPLALTSADFDGDGASDLAIPNRLSTLVSIHRGDATGGFTMTGSFSGGDAMREIAAADLDDDGDQDLAVPNATRVSILLGDGNAGFAPRTSYPLGTDTITITVGDLDGNGLPDLALASAANDEVAILLGVGAGVFGAPTHVHTSSRPFEVELADVDADGDLDLATANASPGTAAIHLGRGNGTFELPAYYPAGPGAASLAAADLDADGKLDLALADPGLDQVALLFGLGAGAFEAPSFLAAGNYPVSLRAADLDADGALDLIAVNRDTGTSSGGALAVLSGNGDRTFEPLQQFSVQNDAIDLTLADFDLDGLLDAATVELGGSPFSTSPGTAFVLLNAIGE
jgi:hypothetical protein